MAQSVEDALIVRLEASLNKFERQLARAKGVATSTSQNIEKRFGATNARIQASANASAGGIMRMVNVSRGGRFVLQNTANQIGDIAVQMGSGTNAARALGQQLPQLFGGFGALRGALGVLGPLMGVVAALGIPLAYAFLTTGEKAATAKDQVKALAAAVGELKSAQSLAATSPADLFGKFRDLSDEAREIYDINRQLASLRAETALRHVSEGLAEGLGLGGAFVLDPGDVADYLAGIEALGRKRDELLDKLHAPRSMMDALPISEVEALHRELDEVEKKLAALGDVSGGVDRLRDMFEITTAEAEEVARLLSAIGAAAGPRQQAQAMLDLSTYIADVSDNLDDAESEGAKFYDRLRDAAMKALELAGIDIASTVGDGADEAARLAENLRLAAGYFGDVVAGRAVRRGISEGSIPPWAVDSLPQSDAEKAYEDVLDRRRRAARKEGRVKGGGGGSTIDRGLVEARRLFDDTRTAAEKYAAEVERINDLHRQFPEVVTGEVKDRALGALDESYSKAAASASEFADVNGLLKDGILDMAMSGGDAMDSLARAFKRAAFEALLFGEGPLGKLFGNIGGGVLKKGLLGGLFSFDGGGYTGPGARSGGLDGRGGFAAMLHPQETVVDHTRGQRLGAGGQMDVRVYVDQSGNWQAAVERISGGVVARAAPAIIATQDRRTGENIRAYSARQG